MLHSVKQGDINLPFSVSSQNYVELDEVKLIYI